MSKQFKDQGANNNKGKGTNRRHGARRPKRKNDKYDGRNQDSNYDDGSDIIGSSNDPKWYSRYPQLVKDVASISFFNPVGSDVDLFTDTSGHFQMSALDGLCKMKVPGLMTLEFAPTFGWTTNFGDQINVAARNVYSYIRAANSGACSYEPADMMMYLSAMDSAYMFYAWMVRLYGIVQMYSPFNKYFPATLIHANHVSFSSLQGDLTKFRQYINTFAVKMGSFVIPSITSYALRHQWMCANIFTDSGTMKAQHYMFVPSGFHVLDETSSDQGTMLKFEKLVNPTDKTKVIGIDTIKNFGDKMIAAIVGSSSTAKISSDIVKCFGADKIFHIDMLPEDYKVTPVYSPEVLTQIQNATIFTEPDEGSLDIKQDVNTQAIITKPTITLPAIWNEHTKLFYKPDWFAIYEMDKIISMPVDNPSPDAVMVATRLTGTSSFLSEHYDKDKLEGTVTEKLDGVGTEIITKAYLYFIPIHDTYSKLEWSGRVDLQNPKLVNGDDTWFGRLTAQQVNALYMGEIFEFHPALYYPVGANTTGTGYTWVRSFDIDNYTTLGRISLQRMHEAALLSELTWDTITSVRQ